jgi:hypothetical protein
VPTVTFSFISFSSSLKYNSYFSSILGDRKYPHAPVIDPSIIQAARNVLSFCFDKLEITVSIQLVRRFAEQEKHQQTPRKSSISWSITKVEQEIRSSIVWSVLVVIAIEERQLTTIATRWGEILLLSPQTMRLSCLVRPVWRVR